jgi:hypothetical protein
VPFTYRYTGDEDVAFVTIQKNARVGGTIESDVPLLHPLLELVEDERVVEVTPCIEEVQKPIKSAIVPETTESPVSGDDRKEN